MAEYPRHEHEVSFYALVRRFGNRLIVTIPKEVRERHNIRAGDVVKVTIVRVTRRER